MSKQKNLFVAVVASALLVALVRVGILAAQVPATSTDATAIMNAVHRRDAGDRMTARMRMRITGSGPERVRTLQVRSLKFQGGTRRLMLFEAPADVRNTGLLMNDHDDPSREDEQWLFLPSLRQTTRIATTRRSGAFVGSDFSFADLTLPHPSRYRHRILRQSEAVDGEDCWVIESTPINASVETETGYASAETWVSKRSFLPLRMKATMRRGRIKYIAMSGVRTIQGIATPSTITARVVFEGRVESQTVLEQSDVRYGDSSVVEADFTTQRLERGL